MSQSRSCPSRSRQMPIVSPASSADFGNVSRKILNVVDSLSCRTTPVGDDYQRGLVRPSERSVDQEALTIAGRRVLSKSARSRSDAGLEERFGVSGLELRDRVDGDCHQLAISSEKEQFVAITPPHRLSTAIPRNLILPSSGGKG